MKTRRQFLLNAFELLGLTAAGALVYPIVRYFSPQSTAGGDKPTILSKKEIAVGESKNIVVNNVPGVLINRPDQGFVAISRVCTHLGCLVEYQKDKKRLFCPCHGATYDLKGNVVSGPPPKPLTQFPLKIEGDSIIIG